MDLALPAALRQPVPRALGHGRPLARLGAARGRGPRLPARGAASTRGPTRRASAALCSADRLYKQAQGARAGAADDPPMVRQSAAARALDRGVPMPHGRDRPEALVESYRRLAEVFHDVLSEQSLDALLDRIAVTLADLMPYEALHIYEVDEDTPRARAAARALARVRDEIMSQPPALRRGHHRLGGREPRARSGRTARTSTRAASTCRGRRTSPRR